jgi:hypothetical protein
MTKVALASRDHQHLEEKQDPAHREFLFHLSRADYEKQFGSEYQHPGWFAKSLAFFFKLIPKFGPLKALQYKDPTPQTEDLYIKSMDNVVRIYVEQAGKMADGIKRSARPEPGYRRSDQSWPIQIGGRRL